MKKGLSLLIIVVFIIGSLPFNFQLYSGGAQTTETYTLWYALPSHIESTLMEKINAFETVNSDIEINATAINEDFRETYFDAFTKDNQPDLILCPTTWIPSLVANDRLKTVTLDQINFREEAVRLVSYYDASATKQTYGYPVYLDTTVTVYNQELFDSYGVDLSTESRWSWDQFENAVRKATNLTNPTTGIYGHILEGMMSFEAFFYGNGSRLFEKYLVDSNHVTGDSEQALGTFNFIDNLLRTYQVAPDWDEQGTLASVVSFINESRVATVFQPISLLYPLLNETDVGEDGDLIVMETPARGGVLHAQAFLLHTDLSTSAVEDLTEFSNFMCSDEVQLSIATDTYLAPTLDDTYLSTEFSNNPVLTTIKAAIDRAYKKPISLYMYGIEGTFQEQVYQFLDGEKTTNQLQTAISIMFKQLLPESALDDGLHPNPPPLPVTNTTIITKTTVKTELETTVKEESGVIIGFELWLVLLGISAMGVVMIRRKQKWK